MSQLNECVENHDFEGAYRLVRENLPVIDKKAQAGVIRDMLKKTTGDRLLLSFLDGVEFGARPLAESLLRLEKLLYFNSKIPGPAGALVLSEAWGLGRVKRLDYFYRRVTVDFAQKKGHQFTYAAACDVLEPASDGHVLVLRENEPERFAKMLKEKPGDVVREVLKSYGDMTIVRLEDVFVRNGFVKAVNWKGFWDEARRALQQDKLVDIPAKRTEPIRLRQAAEDYGDGWLTAFVGETDPKLILAGVREYVAQGKMKNAGPEMRAKFAARMAFAVTAARKVDDALYARLACLVDELKFTTPSAAEMRAYLWDRKRYVKAAAALPAREVGAMIGFLADDEESKARLYAAIPALPFTAVCEIVSRFGGEEACRKAVGGLMRETQAPATLTTLIVGKIEQFGRFEYADVDVGGKKVRALRKYALWPELPPVATLLAHAIALGEGRRGGETLKMQNIVRRLFGDRAWLEKMFSLLSPADQALVFERFQASIAWDPSTHHATVVRMTHIVPALESHLIKVEKKKEYARVTSYRSFALRKQEYLKLINEDMPANVKRIEFAKSYGDLSENAEYQYAKDEQRALMQKQTLMQADLEAVKPDDFADATTDEVMPGVAVVIDANGEEKTYSVLGEWDNDVELGVLSSKAQLAQNMLGKKVGDQFELPGSEGAVAFATVKEIRPLSAEMREWMKLPVGVQI
ncbi:MAG: GreA/GreB family elongation factor [Kiritimatiellae bacterium]|nr:GreA/GreB family elongation factor [Kiritimatiellia bacterium]